MGEHPSYIDNINWYYLPSANPDGYEYSINQDRYWRKNRAPNSGSSCYGTDLNRNWGFHWAETGVSFDPCSEVYCGSAAFDQVESANIRDFVLTLDPLPVLGHSFHSYSQISCKHARFSCGCGPTAMTMERTLRTIRRSSSWLSTPAMHSSRFMALSLTQSTQLIFTQPQELLMTGTNLLE